MCEKRQRLSPSRAAVAIWFVLPLFLACDQISALTATKIKDLTDHPRRYENKEVTVYGTVTDTASLLVVKFFEIQDSTGRIKVVTTRVLPQRGEKLRVTGYPQSIEIGGERLLVLREKTETR